MITTWNQLASTSHLFLGCDGYCVVFWCIIEHLFFLFNAQEPQTGCVSWVSEANHSLISESSSPIRVIRKLMASVFWLCKVCGRKTRVSITRMTVKNVSWIFYSQVDGLGEKQLIGKDPDTGKDWGQEENGGQTDGWIASLIQWTWVWVNSGRWWRTGKPGVLQFMGSQRVRRDWTAQWTPARVLYPGWRPYFYYVLPGILLSAEIPPLAVFEFLVS